ARATRTRITAEKRTNRSPAPVAVRRIFIVTPNSATAPTDAANRTLSILSDFAQLGLMHTPLSASSAALLLALNLFPLRVVASSGRDWPVYLGNKAASHYSTLDQITPGNVRQ